MSTPNVQTIAILGAGQMGGGIAHVSAAGAYTVLLSDVTLARNPGGWSVHGPIFDTGPARPVAKMDARRVEAILAAECLAR